VNKNKNEYMSYATGHKLIHEPVLIEHIHLLQILPVMYNKCGEKMEKKFIFTQPARLAREQQLRCY
jgi:hypothetical protein